MREASEDEVAVGIMENNRDEVIRRLKEELANAQRKLSLLYDQTPIAIIDWDREFHVIGWNATAERIFGYPAAEALSQKGPAFIVPEHVRPYTDQIIETLRTQRGTVQGFNENVTKDGKTVFCEWYNTAHLDADGQFAGVTSLTLDVTARHLTESALRERERAQAETIDQLSTPVLDLWDGVLAVPILGVVEASRASRMTEALLAAIVERGASYTILDLTGVTALETLDTSIAEHIGRLVRAAGLLGATCLVSGLSPALARLFTEQGVELDVRTFANLRAALAFAIQATRPTRPGLPLPARR